MKNAIWAIILAFLATGCSAQNQASFEANPNFSDANMNAALKSESAFCNAVATGQSDAYSHIEALPPRGYRSSFSQSVREIGYTDRLGTKAKSRADYVKASRAFGPAGSQGADMSEDERYSACMRSLAWKGKTEISGREKLLIDKSNRAEALITKIKQDPMASKSIKIMSLNMDRLSYRQAIEEKKRLFADPSIFEQVYRRTRTYVRKNGKSAESRILASSIGLDFARCSAMYNVINQNRTKRLNHSIAGGDRLLSMERESFYYATRLIHVDAAQQEKRAYAKKFQKESGPNLSGIMLRFKEESSQCATMIQGFKRVRFTTH